MISDDIHAMLALDKLLRENKLSIVVHFCW